MIKTITYKFNFLYLFRTQTPTQNINLSVLQNSFKIDVNSLSSNHVIVGPSRIFPGRLSVSRSFDQLAIISSGLGLDDEVVLQGQNQLSDGARIKTLAKQSDQD